MSIISIFDALFNFQPTFSISKIEAKSVVHDPEIYPYNLRDFISAFKRKCFGNPTEIGVVWGTTRHDSTECKHPGYVSDVLYVPELLIKLFELNKRTVIKSYLDIDIDVKVLQKQNFIVLGDGEVNYISSKIAMTLAEASKVKYKSHAEPFFGNQTSKGNHNMYGIVHILANPWNSNYFILHMAGIGPIGTLGAIRWFHKTMCRPKSLPNFPIAIVKAEEKEYPPKFNGHLKHCPLCCKVIDKKVVYWEGKISNVTAVVRVYP